MDFSGVIEIQAEHFFLAGSHVSLQGDKASNGSEEKITNSKMPVLVTEKGGGPPYEHILFPGE